MGLWDKLFGSTPKTIDDELKAIGKALGWNKERLEKAINTYLSSGFTKEEALEGLKEVLKKSTG